jgi:hypothetical protein
MIGHWNDLKSEQEGIERASRQKNLEPGRCPASDRKRKDNHSHPLAHPNSHIIEETKIIIINTRTRTATQKMYI